LKNFRIHGTSPFTILVLHGGPGLPGDVASLAHAISLDYGVIEPFQTKASIDGQVQELYMLIKKHADYPVKLIGHSWGAWLAYIFTFYYPALVEKLVLIGAGAFLDDYNKDLFKTRMDRLSPNQNDEVIHLLKEIENSEKVFSEEHFKRLGEIMSDADSFNCIDKGNTIIEYHPWIFNQVWNEAQELRQNSSLIQMGSKIKCPVLAIHGDYDPHPHKGVSEPLSKVLENFGFILLKQCGHYPWKERYARDQFYRILKKNLE